jgi:nucleoside-diphosphate-sugar epimerase
MKVAVTGASGLLGRFVVAALAGHEVVALDRVRHAAHGTLIVDILDRPGLHVALKGCDAVIHLAAIDGARVATEDAFYEVNVMGTWNVLATTERLGIRRIVVCSSVAALGLRPDAPPLSLPIAVDHPMRPVGAYGLSKQVVETLCAGFAARGRMDVACLRPALIAFPQHMAEWAHVAAEADGLPPPPGVPPVAARVLEPLPMTRAYVGAEDAAAAFAAALTADFTGPCRCYVTAEDTMGGNGPSPFDLEPARAALGWEPRDRWRDLVARHAVR